MIATPSQVPEAVRRGLARHAVAGVTSHSPVREVEGVGPDVSRRAARLGAMRGVRDDASMPPEVRRGVEVLIDAAEDASHGLVGELTDAGIAAARRRHGCECPPLLVRVLRGLLDVAVEAAWAGVRSAGQ